MVAGEPAWGEHSLADFKPIHVIAALELSPAAQAQLNICFDSLIGSSKSQLEPFLTFLLEYIEYNRSKYLQKRTELYAATQELQTLKTDLQQFLINYRNVIAAPPADTQVPPVAQPARPAPFVASQASQPAMPFIASQARQTQPPSVASQARQTQPPSVASQARQPGPVADGLLTVNVDGTVSRKMDQIGNNVTVTFSSNDEIASRKAKICGSSAKMDTFTGQDMNQLPEWVAQFLFGINLYQTTEPQDCRFALHLLRGKAAEMAKNIPQQVSMNNLQELLTGLDKLFNTMGNRVVAVNIFNSYSQREDVSAQEYSIGIEQLFYHSYPGLDPNQSIFLMDRFILGLVSPQIKEKLRIPPQLTNFKDAVSSAMVYTAAIFPEHQTLRQRSLAWKMAASTSHPLLTKSIHGSPRAAIQMLGTSEDEDHVSIQAIKQWCALHKLDKHSDADCRAQQDTTTPSTKKRPTVTKKGNKPRRLCFKTAGDKKKFLRSVEGLEGVSLEDGSDDEQIVEQSLMQLQTPAEETEDDTDYTFVDLHVMMIQPTQPEDTDVIMAEDESLLENQNLDPFGSNIQTTSTADVSNGSQTPITQPTSVTDVLHLEGELTVFEVIEQASNEFSIVNHQLLDKIDRPSRSQSKIHKNPQSRQKCPQCHQKPFHHCHSQQ